MRAVTRKLVCAVFVLAFAATGLSGDTPSAPERAKKEPAAAKAPPAPPAAASGAATAPKPEVQIPLLRPAPRDMDEALRRLARIRVKVTFKDTPFADAVDYVRRLAGFNVIVSPVLQQKGIDGIRPMTMALNDVSLRQLADLVAQFSATKMKFEDGVLQFTTPEDARGKPVLRIYAIGDVTMPLRNFPGPDINLRPHGAEFTPEEESDVPSAWSDPQKIVELIQKTVAEDTWADKDVSISADEHKLIVKQYPEVQRQVARLIALLRAAR